MPHRILIVDDDLAARALVAEDLRNGGYAADVATDGREALELVSSFDPDVVVTEVTMPGMDGIALLKELQRRASPPPVIMMTGHSTHDLAVQGLREGAFDYLTKPVDPMQLRGSVRRAAALRALEVDNRRYQKDLEDNHRRLLESQSELVQAEKMAALGSLVAGVAHEINTPLGSINGNNDIFALTFEKVRAFIGDSEEMAETLSILDETIRTNRLACDRIMKIVRTLRNFARLDEAERKRVDIHDGIESTLILVNHTLRHRIRVVKEFGVVREIECYPNQLNQVFMNMLVNAAQAIEGKGEIGIRTWEEETSVRIAIRDDGKGIAPEMQSKVFDPGYTTKQAGVGTGLGLSICFRIVQNHGGRIDLTSDIGKGSTFTIVLPIREAAERKTDG